MASGWSVPDGVEIMELGERWERKRLMGRRKFIWLYGVLGWGLSVALPWSATMWYFDATHGSYLYWLIVSLMGFLGAGYVVGAQLWSQNEQYFADSRSV
jgi:drug/metabolite transporter (DMT)-like permease